MLNVAYSIHILVGSCACLYVICIINVICTPPPPVFALWFAAMSWLMCSVFSPQGLLRHHHYLTIEPGACKVCPYDFICAAHHNWI